MKSCLIWINLLFVSLFAFAQQDTLATGHRLLLFDEAGCARYHISIQTKQAELTGICIFKNMQEETLGSVFNEFGIKAFDIVYTRRDSVVQLSNTMAALDKWYIKNIIKADLQYLFLSDERGYMKQNEDRVIQMLEGNSFEQRNLKFGITYTYTPITKKQEEEDNETSE